jgi:hypothetical protein
VERAPSPPAEGCPSSWASRRSLGRHRRRLNPSRRRHLPFCPSALPSSEAAAGQPMWLPRRAAAGLSTLLLCRQRLSQRGAFMGSCRHLFASLAGPHRAGRRQATILGPRLAGRWRAVVASSVERWQQVIDLVRDEGVSSPLRSAASWGSLCSGRV